jgi:hypothetical protein
MKRAKHVQIFDGVSRTETVELARRLNLNLKDVSLEQFQKGIKVEREHADAVKRDVITIARIARDHLMEDRKYYDKLEKVEGKHAAKTADLDFDVGNVMDAISLGSITGKKKKKKAVEPPRQLKRAAATAAERPYSGSPSHEKMMMRGPRKKKMNAHDAGVQEGVKLAADKEFADRHRREVRREVHQGRAESKARVGVAGRRMMRRGLAAGALLGAGYLSKSVDPDLAARHAALGGLAGGVLGAGAGRAYGRSKKRREINREADAQSKKYKEPAAS